MGCGNQPAFTALEEGTDECYSTKKPSGANAGGWNHGAYSLEDDIMSLPYVSLGYDQFPVRDTQDNGYSSIPDLNCIAEPKIDDIWNNIKSGFSEFCRDYEMPHPELRMKGDGDEYLMSPSVLSTDYGKPNIPRNFNPPRCENVTDYPIKVHGAEAQNSKISRFQMSGQLSSPRCSTSLLPLVDNLSARGDRNDINIVHISSSSPQKIDQNFLTLGTGGGTKLRCNSKFSTREISSKLEEVSSERNNPLTVPLQKDMAGLTQEAVGDARIRTQGSGLPGPDSNLSARKVPAKSLEFSSQFNNSSIEYCPKNPVGLAQFARGDARFQTNTGGLSISNSSFSAQAIAARELEGFSFQSNNSIVGHYSKNPLNLTQIVGQARAIQTNPSELIRPAYDLMSSISNCAEGGLIGDEGFRLNPNPFPGHHTRTNIPSNTPPKYYTSSSEPTPMSLPCGNTLFSKPNCSSHPQATATYLASHPISWQEDYLRKSSMNMSSESFKNYLSHMHKQSSAGHVQPGSLSSAAQDMNAEGDKIGSFPSNVQPVGQPEAFKHTSPADVPGNYIPSKKTGIQLSKSSSYQPAAAGYFPKRLGLQPNDVATAQSVRGQVVPIANSNAKPQVASVSRPPLKRKAVADPSALSGQRRKIIPPPIISDSTPQQRLSIPTIPARIPAAGHVPPEPLHVKWKGFEEPLEPSEKRCLICKRNLSFTAEGLMYQPTAPPPVAVLPCGHTFHDHCLQIITPQDQSKNPPCIPCAVGET